MQQLYAKLILVNRFVLVVGVVWNAKLILVNRFALVVGVVWNAKLILVNRVVLKVGVVWNAKEAAVSKGAHQATVSCSARVTQRNVIRVAQSTKTSAP